MNARFYSPTTGRFLTADTIIPSPINPQSANRYSYVLGNPIRLIDPSGHVPNQNGWHDRHIGLQNQMQYAVWLIDSLSVNPNVILSTASGYASTAAPAGAAIVGTTWAIAGVSIVSFDVPPNCH